MTKDLIHGAAEFKRYHYGDDNDTMKNLVEMGQDPKYFIISCIDSRCNPYTIFRAPPGLFFTHKAMGAIVRPYKKGTALAAALQFAINYNKIEHVIVLGHTECGAIKALVSDIEDEDIKSFINVAKHGMEKACECSSDEQEIIGHTEKNVILESMTNLKTYPSVSSALKKRKIKLKAWQFDMTSGDLLEYNTRAKKFKVLKDDDPVVESRHPVIKKDNTPRAPFLKRVKNGIINYMKAA